MKSVARALSGYRYVPIALTALIGTLTSIGIFWLVLSWENRVAQIDFESKAQIYLQSINADLNDANTLLYTIGAYVETNEHEVSRRQFSMFAQVLHDRVVALRNIGWAPRVGRAERASFERHVLAPLAIAGHGRIVERSPRGTFRPAAARDAYYPILYVETGMANRRTELRRLLGFDLTSEPLRAAALAKTVRTGLPAATPPLRLITVKGSIGGVMGFMAVGRGSHRPGAPPLGVVLGAFDIGAMVENIIAKKMRAGGFELYLFDPAGRPGHRLVYWHRSLTGPAPAPAESALLQMMHWEGSVSMIDQRWRAIVTPASAARASDGVWYAWMALGAGLTMTAMIVAYLLISLRRARHLEAITANLRAATDDLHRNIEQMEHMARHDALTGLPNRTLFRERIEAAVTSHRHGVAFTILYLDLDRFKAVNDTLGHSAGDKLLCAAAARISTCLREIDTVARLGGDEFAIVLVDQASESDVAQIAERLISEVGRPYLIDERTVIVGLSIGVAIARAGDDATTADGVLKEADLALYEAKGAGRGTYRFFERRLRLPK